MKDKFYMSSIGELTFFLGLQVKQKDDEIFIIQDTYVAKILRKCGFTYVKLASTPIKTEKPLLKDPDGEDVDVHIYSKELASLKQTALGKDISNLFMAGVNTPRCDEDSIELIELMVFKEDASNRGEIEAIDADEDITLMNVEKDEEATLFDEEVTKTMAQTLIKIKEEKAKLQDEQKAQKLHNGEVQKVAAKDKQKRMIWKSSKRHLDNIKKYQSLKKKPVSTAQARKNMIIYLKNMAEHKMGHFRGMTYDKKRVADETLLQESFKKLKAVEVSSFESTQEIPSNDLKEMSEGDVQNMLEIVLVFEFKVEALQVKYPIIDWEIHNKCARTY
nr:ribonuclease H-like domain-containing protein [Tanacetum cinerariifolium]